MPSAQTRLPKQSVAVVQPFTFSAQTPSSHLDSLGSQWLPYMVRWSAQSIIAADFALRAPSLSTCHLALSVIANRVPRQSVLAVQLSALLRRRLAKT